MEGKRSMPAGELALVAAFLAALVVGLASGAAFAGGTPAVLSRPAKSAEVQTRTLDNGLQVLVLEDHSAPLVCSFIWYRVGLRNEGPREAGLSHFLEHMLFKGSEKYSGREVDRLITQRGGYYNGFTSMDYTAFVETIAPSSLDLALDIESQRMAHALIAAEDVESEKGVVISEFEGSENSPSFLLRKKVMEAQFPGEPYGRQVIGDKDDLHALTREQVLSYYHHYYVPNNASLVVVGDVSAADVFAKAQQYFGGIPRGNTPPPAPNPGRGPTGEKRVTLDLPGRTSYVQAVYQVPPIQGPDHVALEVLQNVLSGGRTGRLYQGLVDTGIAADAYGADYENPEPTVFAFEIALRPGVPHQRAEDALGKVLADVQNTLVGEEELQKAKNQTKANFVYSADGVTKLAQQIGYYHTIYTYQYLKDFPAKVDAITAADLQRVAKQYFVPQNRTMGWLVATGENGGTGGPAMPPGDVQRSGRQPLALAGGGAASVLQREAPPVREVRLPNGMEVILQQNRSAPFVVTYGNIMAGPVFDPGGKAGLAAFTAEMVSRGTQKRTWQQIQEELEFVAAQLGFGTGQQVATVAGQCLKGDLPLLLAAAAEQLREPSFPQDEIDKVRSEILTAQERRDEDTFEVAQKDLFARLYPVGHPLHSPPLGDADSINSITRDDLVAFHKQWYRPENMILAVVGDIDLDEAEALARKTFGDWPRGGEPARPRLPQVPVPDKPETIAVPIPNKTQTDIAIGFPGISRRDPGYYPADLMNYVLGRGFVSRLNLRIREDLGAAYYVMSNYYAYWGPGPWALQMGVNPARAKVAIAAAIEEVRKMQQAPPSDDELQLWKGYVEGTVARQMETFGGIAQNLVLASFYDLGLDFPYRYPKILKAITADQVWQAAKEHLYPDGAITIIAGPVEEEGPPPAAGK
jgi:zinc protease